MKMIPIQRRILRYYVTSMFESDKITQATLLPYALCVLALCLCAFFLTEDMLLQTSQEGAFLENLTALKFLGASLLGSVIVYKTRIQSWTLFAIFMGFAFARELDWHKAFTSDSILKIKFYTNPEYALPEKMIGFIFVLLLITSIFLLFKYIPRWIKELKELNVFAVGVFLGLGSIVAGKMLDAKSRLIPQWTDFFERHDAELRFLEESMELLGAAVFLVIAIIKLKQIRQEN